MGYAGEGEREREGVQGVDEVIGNGEGMGGEFVVSQDTLLIQS